jgi:hypothetical protein
MSNLIRTIIDGEDLAISISNFLMVLRKFELANLKLKVDFLDLVEAGPHRKELLLLFLG